MMFSGTTKPFESPVSQTPTHPTLMLNPGDTTHGYFIFTTQTHHHQGRKIQGVLQEAFQTKSSSDRCFMF